MKASGERSLSLWQPAEGRRFNVIVVVVRYLVGRTAIDQLKRISALGWLIAAVGLGLLIIGPRIVGVALLVLAALVACARFTLVRVIDRMSLARQYRPIESEFSGAVEAGKANIRRELERVGLPSTRWRMPMFLVRLARRSGRDEVLGRLSQIDLSQVLPQVQIDRAFRLLDGVWQGA